MTKTACALLLSGVIAAGAWGQARGPEKMRPGAGACRACHTSDAPSREKPDLAKCPRATIPGYHPVAAGPETITIGSSAERYGPVRFAHRKHAEMAEMGDGCYGCHHYNEARPIHKCEECHSASRIRTDLGKPDLKGARHRLCVDCHMRWSHAVSCDSCHARAGAAQSQAFPPAALPRRVLFETHSIKGRFVTFFHGDHAVRFGLKCTDCHHGESCVNCHDAERIAAGAQAASLRRVPKTGSMRDLHKPCFSCHASVRCGSCHMDKPMERFDHGRSAGWALNRFHGRLACQRCHGAALPFAKLSADCESCHPDWRKTFDHKRTGLALDETHAALECDSCHGDRTLAARPSCLPCHEDRSYPHDRPGRPWPPR
jgi:hypothetical protein